MKLPEEQKLWESEIRVLLWGLDRRIDESRWNDKESNTGRAMKQEIL